MRIDASCKFTGTQATREFDIEQIIAARKLSVFSSLMSNYSFNNNFCQKIIIYLESLYNKLYFDIKFISEYWFREKVRPVKILNSSFNISK
jgi:hypothetical protein